MTAQMFVPNFYVKQKFVMTTNRYELYVQNPDGSYGQLLGVAQQKRLALKENITFYTDETRSRAVFSFKARKRVELHSEYDVLDEGGQPLGTFRKDFGKSLLRSTYHLEGPGYAGTGQERSKFSALVRRFSDVPLPIHFDYASPDGARLMSVERKMTIGDRYSVHVDNDNIDFRVAAAVAVGMDALMQR